jgi:excisionase family DNA binding protein
MPKPTKAKPPKPAAPRPEANGAAAPEVMTLAEGAAFLRVAEGAVVELLDAGQIPARQVRGEWRILKEALVDWLRRRELSGEAKAKSMLSVVGAFKDDETLRPMVEEIYRQRRHSDEA